MKAAVLAPKRLTVTWLVLVAATALSWAIGHGAAPLAPKNEGMAIILIAFLKIRLVILEFMEIRHAPILMRIVCESWIVIICASIVLLYRT